MIRPRWPSSLALVLGCGHEPSVVEPSPVEPSLLVRAEPTADPELASAAEQLAALAVYHDDFARAELYTWTTPAQLEQLRASRCLLHAEASTGQTSAFSLALQAIPRDGSAHAQIAELLVDHEALKRRRYAWPSGFATTLGLGSRRYGDVLIRIDLDPRSFVARFEPASDPPLTFVDMQGEAVTPERVLADPTRLAAVYHVGQTSPSEPAYREYVVCSEAMILAWSVATPEIAVRVEREIDMLVGLADSTLAQLPRAAVEQGAAIDWSTSTPIPAPPLAAWHASLAFDNLRYRPTPAGLRRIIAALRETRAGQPLIHDPRIEPCQR